MQLQLDKIVAQILERDLTQGFSSSCCRNRMKLMEPLLGGGGGGMYFKLNPFICQCFCSVSSLLRVKLL